ncbi:MAG: hypothetical protein P8N40_09630, partial [Gammaproteobacteria bacterium]|nr:hypothetical protein [Gammaproteobacteria bacterium]
MYTNVGAPNGMRVDVTQGLIEIMAISEFLDPTEELFGLSALSQYLANQVTPLRRRFSIVAASYPSSRKMSFVSAPRVGPGWLGIGS